MNYIENLPRYIKWKEQWEKPDDMDLLSYIGFNIHPEDALITFSLLRPDLIEVDNLLFLSFKYDEDNYLDWKEKSKSDNTSIQKMINHVHIYDLFDHCTDNVSDDVFDKIGKILHREWEIYFKVFYPDKNIVVEYNFNDLNYGPILTVYQNNIY